MGHKHKSSKKRKHRSSKSSDELESTHKSHHKKHKKEKKKKAKLVPEYISSETSDSDDVMELAPPPSKISPPSPPVSAPISGDGSSLSVAETNALRLKLGLAPLKMSSSSKPEKKSHEEKNETGGVDMGNFVHKPAENLWEKQNAEKMREKISARRQKRQLEEKYNSVKKLAEEEEGEEEDVRKWVEKNRKITAEREKAEKKARELDAMDEIFGVGDLIEEDKRVTKKEAYSGKHLKGLKVEHSLEDFAEGRSVILTLKDKDVLDEEQDSLVNVNMLDSERYKKNVMNRKMGSAYKPYDDEEFSEDQEFGADVFKGKVLAKYDEEIEGVKKKSFAIGIVNSDESRQAVKSKLESLKVGKRLESLQMPAMRLATDYYTESEMAVKFKKRQKKVRKIRKKKPLTADDLLNMSEGVGADDGMYDPFKEEIKSEAEERDSDNMDIDENIEVPLKLEEGEDDDDLQIALQKARRLQQMESLANIDKLAESIKQEVKEEPMGEEEEVRVGGTNSNANFVINSTAEFCRTLGDIPTYGQAGNREDNILVEFDKKESKDEKQRIVDEKKKSRGGWNEVEFVNTAIDMHSLMDSGSDAPVLGEEPELGGAGVAGALKLAMSKGYIEKEKAAKASGCRFAHLQAQNYSIDDKATSEIDEKHGRGRERYNGPTTDFKEKEGYKPNVKLDYIGEDGLPLSAKEAFRHLSHKFHGKGPGKNKIEKRLKKSEQELLMKQMSSTDTPLGTLNMLQQKQKEQHSAFVVLSGSKMPQSTSLRK